MANKKLTPEQNCLIESITKEFIALNTKEAPTNGILDVSSILAKIKREENFNQEYNITKKMYERKLNDQIKADVKSIESDLKLLGLAINIKGNCVTIYGDKYEKEGPDNFYERCHFRYVCSHYIDFKRDEFTRRIDTIYKIKANFIGNHFGEHYDDITQMVNRQAVKDRLGAMYLHNKKH